jgi:pyrrolysine biosynthesis protein PylD
MTTTPGAGREGGVTRLESPDVDPIPGNLAQYDAALRRKTGLSLRQIACKAAGIAEDRLGGVMGRMTVAAVPVSSGRGVIRGFSHAVAAIVAHLGFRSFVTSGRDVAGIAEALERGAEILLLADDRRFVAMAPGRRRLADNARATARGFVAGLEAMRGEITGASALVLGCGPVGVAGAEALLERGATVALLDSNRGRATSARILLL